MMSREWPSAQAKVMTFHGGKINSMMIEKLVILSIHMICLFIFATTALDFLILKILFKDSIGSFQK